MILGGSCFDKEKIESRLRFKSVILLMMSMERSKPWFVEAKEQQEGSEEKIRTELRERLARVSEDVRRVIDGLASDVKTRGAAAELYAVWNTFDIALNMATRRGDRPADVEALKNALRAASEMISPTSKEGEEQQKTSYLLPRSDSE